MYQGVQWRVLETNPQKETLLIQRDLGDDSYQIQVTAEALWQEQAKAELEDEARRIAERYMSDFPQHPNCKSTIVDPYDRVEAITARRRTEREAWEKLTGYGITQENAGESMRNLISNLAAQMNVMSEAATSAFGQLKPLGDLLRDSGFAELSDDELVSRQALMDAKYAQPESEGWAVVYQVHERRGPSVMVGVVINGQEFGNHIVTYCESVESAEAAWQFVDYLNDDEAGKPVAIRQDSVVVYVNEGSGWESLSPAREPVPEAYR